HFTTPYSTNHGRRGRTTAQDHDKAAHRFGRPCIGRAGGAVYASAPQIASSRDYTASTFSAVFPAAASFPRRTECQRNGRAARAKGPKGTITKGNSGRYSQRLRQRPR
ncbi:hypothetical protein LPJ71_009117, partial [Coemansia sp. S17]